MCEPMTTPGTPVVGRPALSAPATRSTGGADYAEILSDISRGLSYSQVALRHGKTRSQIAGIVYRHGDSTSNDFRRNRVAARVEMRLAARASRLAEAVDRYVAGATFNKASSGVCSPSVLRREVERRGFEVRDQWAHLRGVRHPKIAEIIEQRERKRSYKEIGEQFGLSKERVRQLLHQSGRSDLCGHFLKRVKRNCPACGREIVVQPSSTKRHCNARCAGEMHPLRVPRAVKEALVLDIETRRQMGEKWREIASAVGVNGVPQAIAKYNRYKKSLSNGNP